MQAPIQARTAPIDWVTIKSNYNEWRSTLWTETKTTLKEMAVGTVSMAHLNTLGAYHKVGDGHQDVMKKEYKESQGVPHKWVYKGNFPGIWCALFNKHNTYSVNFNPPIVKFTFKAEYQIFDPMLEQHKKMWEA